MRRLIWLSSLFLLLAACTQTPAQPTVLPTTETLPILREVLAQASAAVVRIVTPEGSGSGFIFDADGWVLTNAHVVGDFEEVEVILGGRFTYRGTVIGLDEEKDVAVIQLNVARGGQLPVLAMASELVGPGDDVVAIGYPLSNILGSEPTISRGVVSALRTYIGVEYIQIDAAINPGNSGGPLVNSQGEFVGINTAKLDFVGNIPVEGVGFAISIESFKELLPFLRAGRVARLERTATPTVHRATPTPIQLLHDTDWETYVGEFEQYSIRLAPNWTVEDFDPGSVSLGSPDGRASLVITTFERPHLSLMALIDDLVNTLAEENGEALHITRGPSEIGHPSGVVTFELVFRLEDSLGNSDCFARILAFELNKTKAYVLIGTACGTGSGLNFGDIEVMQNNFLVK